MRKSRGSVQGPRCVQSERDHGRRPRSCLPLSRWRDAKPRRSGATPCGAELRNMPGSKASLDGTISRACYLRLLREKPAATGTSAEGHAKGNRVSARDG